MVRLLNYVEVLLLYYSESISKALWLWVVKWKSFVIWVSFPVKLFIKDQTGCQNKTLNWSLFDFISQQHIILHIIRSFSLCFKKLIPTHNPSLHIHRCWIEFIKKKKQNPNFVIVVSVVLVHLNTFWEICPPEGFIQSQGSLNFHWKFRLIIIYCKNRCDTCNYSSLLDSCIITEAQLLLFNFLFIFLITSIWVL